MSLGLGKRIELEMRGRPADLIKDLNLDNCRANKIEGLTSEFTNLQTLSLINLGLQTLENFPKLGNLRKLELSDNRITGGLNHLTGCASLTHLSLSGNKIKDFDVLDPLKDLAHLRSLDLFNCEVTNDEEYRDKVFEKLKQLIYLDGFDREEKEQEDVDGEDEDEDDEDDDDVGDEDDDDDDEDEDEDDTDGEDDYEPGEVDDDDDQIVENVENVDDEDDDDEDDDAAVEDGEDDDEEDEGEEDDEEQRGTKRKHDDEEEGGEEDDEEA